MDKSLLNLDFKNKKKLCDQVLAEIRSQILSGQLPAGERLPTVRALASQLNINFNTVARAYRILDQEGWITTRQGRGTFVVSKGSHEQSDQQQSQNEAVNQIVMLLITEAQKLDKPISDIFERVERRLRGKGLLIKKSKRKGRLLLSSPGKKTPFLKEVIKPGSKDRQIHSIKRTLKKLKV